MSEPKHPPFLAHFAALRDPRQAAKVLYPLPEILLLLVWATLSGVDDFVEINLWGQEYMGFLRRFQPYERGIPSPSYSSHSSDSETGMVQPSGII